MISINSKPTTPRQLKLLFVITILCSSPLILTSCGDDDGSAPPPDEGGITVETVTINGTYRGDDGISIDANGALYTSNLASGSGTTLYKVATDGTSTVFGSGLSAPMGHTFDASGNLLVSNDNSTSITQIDPQGQASDFLTDARFQGGSLARGSDGSIYHSVYSTDKVYKISPTKEVTEIAGGGTIDVPFGIAVDENDNVYVANFSNGIIHKITPSGGVSVLATIPSIIGYITYANNRLYATGFNVHKIFEVGLDGSIAEIAGTGTPGNIDGGASTTSFFSPNGIIASADGKSLFVSQKNFVIRKVNLE